MINRIISGARAAGYALTEPRRVRRERKWNWVDHENHAVYVITPTFNRAELLKERAWKSLCNQTFTHWTWIVIGDHCTDKTAEMMDAIMAVDARVYFFNMPPYKKRHPNTAECRWFCGPVYALNEALALIWYDYKYSGSVLGEWVANLDDDDIWEPTHLADIVKFAVENKLEFASAWNDELREDVHKIVRDDPATPGIGARATWLYRSYLSFMRYNVNCFRKRLNRVNDLDMAERFLKAGVRCGQIPAVHAYSIPRPNETQIGLKAYKEAESKGYDVHG